MEIRQDRTDRGTKIETFSRFRGLLNRVALAPKMLLVTALAGVFVWGMLDYFHTKHLTEILEAELSQRLNKQAEENRIRFDNYVSSYNQTARLITSQQNFLDYISGRKWPAGVSEKPVIYSRIPPWLPDSSVMRRFAHIHYALLIDGNNIVREIYQESPEIVPGPMFNPSSLIRQLSMNQSFMTIIEGMPYLLTSESIQDAKGRTKATLLLIDHLDDDFLEASQGMSSRDNIVALVTDEQKKILASNRPELLPPGVSADSLKNNYIIIGKSFFDWGASDLRLQFTTLISRAEFKNLNQKIIFAGRIDRAMVSGALLISFLIIIYLIARQIQAITGEIVGLSKDELGIDPLDIPKGDELHVLKNLFERYVKEVIEAREAKYRRLHESMTDAFVIVDMTGNIMEFNRVYQEMLGYSSDELKILTYNDLTPAKWHDIEQRIVKDEILLKGHSGIYEKEYSRKDGSVFPVELRSFLIRNKEGKAAGMWAIVRDITERKSFLAKLKDSEQKFRAVFDYAHDGILVADAETAQLFMFNKKICEMLGYSSEEMAALRVQNIHPADSLPLIGEKFQAIIEGKTILTEDLPVLRKDGSIFYADISASPVEFEGRLYAVGIFRDITERRNMEARMAASLMEKEMLLREIHHRVKNNLQIISSLLYFQTKKMKDPSGLAALRDGQDRLRSMILVHEMLYRSKDLSRINFGSYMSTLTTQMVQSYAEMREKVSITIHADEIFLPIEIALPSGMILNEIITNIYKYAFPDDLKGSVFLGMSLKNNMVFITIKDTGVGLPAEVDTEHPATFGLQLVRNLTAQLGGTISFRRNGGTSVYLEIPVDNMEEGVTHG